MTQMWLESNFSVDPLGNRIVATSLYAKGDSMSFPDSVLTAMATSDPPTYAEISALPQASAGWQPIFDQWKARGLVD